MSTTIPWIQYTEAVVAQGHPTLLDVTNRPLSTVMATSGYGLTTPFFGFASGILNPGSPAGVFAAPEGFLYQESNPDITHDYPLWVKISGAGVSGWQSLNDFTGYPVTAGSLAVIAGATIGTTLGVTGATTLGSTLSVAGLASLNLGLTVIGGNTSVTTLSSSGLATLNSLGVTNGATFNGLVTFNASIHGSLTPDVDATYNIGTASFRWNAIRGMSHIAGTDNGSAASIRTQTGLSSTFGTDLRTLVIGDNQNLSAIGSASAYVVLLGSNIAIVTGSASKQTVGVGDGVIVSNGGVVIGAGASDTSDGTISGFGGSNGVTIGQGTISFNYRGVHIGYAINIGFAGGKFSYQNVIIGSQIQVGSQTDRQLTVIGDSSSISGWTGGGSGNAKLTAIGGLNTVTGATGATIILGGNNSVTTAGQIIVGVGNVAANLTQANALYIGGPDLKINNVIIGSGDTVASPAVLTLRGTNATGVDNVAGDLLIQSGLSTGAGTPSRIRLRVAVAGVSGAALQVASDMLIISSAGFSFGSNLSPTVDATYSLGTGALRWTTGNFSSYIAIGTTVATTGAIRLGNNVDIRWRNAGNTADLLGMRLDGSNNMLLGGLGVNSVQFLNSGGSTAWQFSSASFLITGLDNTYDIGASGATRPRSLYIGTSGVFNTDPGGSAILRVGQDLTNGSFNLGGFGSLLYTPTSSTLFALGGIVTGSSQHTSTGSSVYGLVVTYTSPTTATVSQWLTTRPAIANAAAISTGVASYLTSPNIGAGATATTWYGHRIDNQGFAGATTSYALFVNSQSGSTNTYAFYVNGGLSYFGSPISVVGNPGMNYDHIVRVGYSGAAHPSSATSVIGYSTDFTGPSTATASIVGVYIRNRTAAAAFTVAQMIGSQVDTFILGAGSTVTTFVAYNVQTQTAAAGTIIGVNIGNITGGATNYAIKTGTGLISVGDKIQPGASNTIDLGTSSLEFRTLYLGTSIFVGANQVVGARQTGWVVATGTPSRATYATSTVTLATLAGVVMALEQDLITHGLIGT